jgi:hypothetical protein
MHAHWLTRSEMAPKTRCTSNDCEINTNCICPTNHEQRSKLRLRVIGENDSCSSNAGKDVKAHSGCFGYHLTKSSWSCSLEVKF